MLPRQTLHTRDPSARRRWARRLCFAAALLVAAEGALRLLEAIRGRLPGERLPQSLKLAPGSQFACRSVNSLGYWDDEFQRAPLPGLFRVAVLGGRVTLSGPHSTDCLTRLEQSVEGIEVCHFGLPSGCPRHYARQVAVEVAEFRPHLVLAFFSAGDDLLAPPPPVDWRRLRLARWAASWFPWQPSSGVPVGSPEHPPIDYEGYLRLCGERLWICRTPIDGPLERRWREALDQLAELARQCRRRRLPLALALAPAEFQVDRRVYETLRRRGGLEAARLDLELPQRRLVQFADAHELPVVDLLPHFRACDASPYARHGTGWNERGHELAARVLGTWLRSQFGAAIGKVTLDTPRALGARGTTASRR